MRKTLVDAGPLIALFDRDDQYHTKAVEFLRTYHGSLVTTWPVIAEATHMLDFSVAAQVDFLTWIQREGVNIFQIDYSHIEQLVRMFEKDADLPMDLADGTLLIAAEELGIRSIISIDRDFYIYQIGKNIHLRNIFN